MACELTKLRSLSEMDFAALKARYLHERDKRLRPEGGEQYVRPTDRFAETYEHDPHTQRVVRKPVSEELEVAVLGGGWTGLLAGYHLQQAGITGFRHIEHGGDFGGVWYWNRYPGIQCDNDAYCYLPLLEETGFMPSQKFADGKEIQGYCRLIGEKYGFYDKALFHTIVTSLRWDAVLERWRIATSRGDDLRARFVIMAGGLMNMPKLPGIPGIDSFTGRMFHTARWDYDFTGGAYGNPVLDRLADKRVAIVGTGATAIQAVPFLAQHAKHLHVLQRTPSTVDERPNPTTDPEWAKALQPGWQQLRQANFHRGAQEQFMSGEADEVCDIWTEISRHLDAQLAADGRPALTLAELAAQREAIDHGVMDRLRRRIEGIVADPATAELLKPWFRLPCKRPLSNNAYFPSFNRANVSLHDVSATQGVERITVDGFVVGGVEHAVDCMIFASGFEVTSDLARRWGIATVEGRDGVSIYQHWADGPATLHGAMTHGFPNMFFTGYIQGALNSTTTEQFNRQAEHIAYIIAETRRRGATYVEPTRDAQDAYVRHFAEIEVDTSALVAACTPSYYNNEGEDKPRWLLLRGYGHGWNAFQALLADWRAAGDMPGMRFSP